MKKTVFAAVALALAVGVAHGAGDPEAGKTKSATCQACHGADGNSLNPMWPKLAGQQADYTAKQLAEFKSGKRQDPTMAPMAAALSEQDMADLGAYYASQTATIAGAAQDMVEAGGAVYRGGNKDTGVPACMGCHGPSGAGVPGAGFPSLGGQHADYTVKTLNDFRTGARNNDVNNMMRDIAARMSDEEIKAVAQFAAGLH